MNELDKKGIGNRSYFIPAHQQPVFQKMGLFKNEYYPVSEELSRKGCYLPSGIALTERQIVQVCQAIADIQKE